MIDKQEAEQILNQVEGVIFDLTPEQQILVKAFKVKLEPFKNNAVGILAISWFMAELGVENLK